MASPLPPDGATRWFIGPPWLAVVVGTIGAIAMVLTGSVIGAVPHPVQDHWWFTVPIGGGWVAHVSFALSIAVFVAGWIGVGIRARHGGLSVAGAWVALVAWATPFLVGVPLFSRDLYSYVAQGQLAQQGFNPYSAPPSALGPGEIFSSVAHVWQHTPSPYGPLFVALSHVAASVGGTSLVSQILVFRLVEMIGVVLIMVSLPTLARQRGFDPGLSLWLGALSPLALFSFVSSGHNDALMVGLMVAGLALGTSGWLRWGVALCALAATIKLPAAAGIVFLVADRFSNGERSGRWRQATECVMISVLVIAAVSYSSGYGWAWLSPAALRIPTYLKVLITPVVSLGSFLGALGHALGLPITVSGGIAVVQVVSAAMAALGIVWMVFHVHGQDAIRLCGLSLLLFALLSPTLWPWYLVWGTTVLAATAAQRSLVLATVAALAMLMVGAGGTPLVNGGDYWVLGVLLTALVAWSVVTGRWRVLIGGPAHVG